MSSPAIVFKNKFSLHNNVILNSTGGTNNYGFYVDYMDREDTKMEEKIEELNKVSDSIKNDTYIQYMENPLKTNNVFNEGSQSLSKDEIKKIKESFVESQKNESPMWQQVFSFDNNFLKENGLLAYDGKLYEEPLKNATKLSMKEFKDQMNFNDTMEWVGAIHYNTDNIHIHIAVVEQESSRPIIESGKYAGQRKAKVPQRIMKQVKSKFINSMIDRNYELNRINDLMRLELNQQIKELNLGKDILTIKKINTLMNELPADRRLWKYNNNVLKKQRPCVDDITKEIINRNDPNSFKELEIRLDDEERFRKQIYGESKESYKENKLLELNAMMGNALLRNMNSAFPKESYKKSNTLHYELKVLGYQNKNLLYNLSQLFNKNKQDYLNEINYNRNQIEKENEDRFLQNDYDYRR
ncbi:MobP2 family relaxase [Fundicoccus sp. Sow4_H7]|uniref:MobP2 family relaxase n=1 Tax=Fundicoccus sp. Sow4_H7 TaxID=3438784 RepID=UPI003F925083